MLRGVRIKRINKNIRFNNSRLSGHRCRCRGGAMSLWRQGSRPAIQARAGRSFILKKAQYGVLHQMLGVRPGLGGYLLKLRFLLGCEMYFHGFKIRENWE